MSSPRPTQDARRVSAGPLKIAFVVPFFPRLSETFILNQITGLLDRGHDVQIYATRPGGDRTVHLDVTQYNLLRRTHYIGAPPRRLDRVAKAVRLLATHLLRRPLPLVRSLNVARYRRRAIELRTLYIVVPFLTRYDIVHCQFGTIGQTVGALLKELGLQRTLVTTFHGFDTRLAEKGGRAKFQRLLVQGDCFVAISPYNYRRLLELGVDPAKVVYHPVGIDCRQFPFRQTGKVQSQDGVAIVTVARLVPEKGLHFGIRAVSRLAQQRPDLRLRYDIIGGGPLRAELATLIRQLGLESVVHLHGPQPHDQIIRMLQRSDIFLLPSVAEAMPVVLLEAQALGLPVIATAVGSTDAVVLDGVSGFLVPPGDIEAMAARLELLVDQPELWATLGEAGNRHVRAQYDVNVLNDRLVEIYRRVLDGGL